VPKLVWRVKLVSELRPGVMTETEVARIERDEEAGLADLGLRLAETKPLTAALQAEIVPAQVTLLHGSGPGCRRAGGDPNGQAHSPPRNLRLAVQIGSMQPCGVCSYWGTFGVTGRG